MNATEQKPEGNETRPEGRIAAARANGAPSHGLPSNTILLTDESADEIDGQRETAPEPVNRSLPSRAFRAVEEMHKDRATLGRPLSLRNSLLPQIRQNPEKPRRKERKTEWRDPKVNFSKGPKPSRGVSAFALAPGLESPLRGESSLPGAGASRSGPKSEFFQRSQASEKGRTGAFASPPLKIRDIRVTAVTAPLVGTPLRHPNCCRWSRSVQAVVESVTDRAFVRIITVRLSIHSKSLHPRWPGANLFSNPFAFDFQLLRGNQ